MVERSYKCLQTNNFDFGCFELVPIRDRDKFDIMKWRNEQVYHLRQSESLTIQIQESYFENVVSKLFDEERPNQLLFSFLKDNECIGYGGLVHINWLDRNAEVSFIMNTDLEDGHFCELWTAYLYLIEKLAFKELGLHKLFTYAFDVRPQLYPMLIDNGYGHEATLMEHCAFDGKFKNVLIHSKIRTIPYLRKATITDIDTTFIWAIDPLIRSYSFDKKLINYEDHCQWYKSRITSEGCLYYILFLEGTPLGSIRIDINSEREGLISYLIDPNFQGKGYGRQLLQKIEEIAKEKSIRKLVGFVLTGNMASIKLFKCLNYVEYKKEGEFIFEKEMK